MRSEYNSSTVAQASNYRSGGKLKLVMGIVTLIGLRIVSFHIN